MKQFIVLCSTIILGISIYNLIMGSSDESIIKIVEDVWYQGIQIRTNSP